MMKGDLIDKYAQPLKKEPDICLKIRSNKKLQIAYEHHVYKIPRLT